MDIAKAWIPVCFGLGLLVAACTTTDNEDGAGNGLKKADLVGDWTVVSAHDSGWIMEEGSKQTVDEDQVLPSEFTIRLGDDDSLKQKVGGFPLSGTWFLKGDSLYFVLPMGGLADTVGHHVALSGNQATLSSREADDSQDIVTTLKATRKP